MRNTITKDFERYFRKLGTSPRMTWEGLWDKVADALPFEVSVNVGIKTTYARLTDKKTGDETGKWLFTAESFTDKYGDIDQALVCHNLCRRVMAEGCLGRPKKTYEEVTEEVKVKPAATPKKVSVQAPVQAPMSVRLMEAEREADRMRVRIYTMKKRGEDVTGLLPQYATLKEIVKTLKGK